MGQFRHIFLLFLSVAFTFFSCSSKSKTSLVVLTASGLKEPFNQLVEKYQKEHPEEEIKVIYGGSGNLLALLEEGKGDLFIPAGEFYIKLALKRELIDPSTVRELTQFVPVLVVKDSFASKVKDLKDLVKVPLKVGLGDPKAASIGRVSKQILEKAGIWNLLKDKIVVKTATVSQLLVYLKTGQIDATIIWKHLVRNLKGFKVIPITKPYLVVEKVEISVSKTTKYKMEAESFETFLLENRKFFDKTFR